MVSQERPSVGGSACAHFEPTIGDDQGPGGIEDLQLIQKAFPRPQHAQLQTRGGLGAEAEGVGQGELLPLALGRFIRIRPTGSPEGIGTGIHQFHGGTTAAGPLAPATCIPIIHRGNFDVNRVTGHLPHRVGAEDFVWLGQGQTLPGIPQRTRPVAEGIGCGQLSVVGPKAFHISTDNHIPPARNRSTRRKGVRDTLL